MLPELAALFTRARVAPREITAVFVGTGPGSFTGLRVGIATAFGLARGTGAALYAIPSTESLAFGALAPGESAAVLFDARGGLVSFAYYLRTESEIETRIAPCALTPESAREHLARSLAPAARLFGDSTVAAAAGLGGHDRARLETDLIPQATPLLELASARLELHGPQRREDIEPLYLRPFEAKARTR